MYVRGEVFFRVRMRFQMGGEVRCVDNEGKLVMNLKGQNKNYHEIVEHNDAVVAWVGVDIMSILDKCTSSIDGVAPAKKVFEGTATIHGYYCEKRDRRQKEVKFTLNE